MVFAHAFSQGPSTNWSIYFDSHKLPLCTHKTASPSRGGGGTCPGQGDIQDSWVPSKTAGCPRAWQGLPQLRPHVDDEGNTVSAAHGPGWVNIFPNNPHTFPLPQRKTWPPCMINALFLYSPRRLSKCFLHVTFLGCSTSL